MLFLYYTLLHLYGRLGVELEYIFPQTAMWVLVVHPVLVIESDSDM